MNCCHDVSCHSPAGKSMGTLVSPAKRFGKFKIPLKLWPLLLLSNPFVIFFRWRGWSAQDVWNLGRNTENVKEGDMRCREMIETQAICGKTQEIIFSRFEGSSSHNMAPIPRDLHRPGHWSCMVEAWLCGHQLRQLRFRIQPENPKILIKWGFLWIYHNLLAL